MTRWPINAAGVRLLKEFESFAEFAYPDPASPLYRAAPRAGWGKRPAREILATLPSETRKLSGAPWTIGFGFTKGVTPDDRMTLAEADARLAEELREATDEVRACLTLPANENQLAAMVSLRWNIGIAGFRRSTVLKAHNRGDFESAARAFALWNKAGGRVMRGLTRRRAAEAALYLAPVPGEIERLPIDIPGAEIELMPQTIEPERPMFRSRIAQTTTVSGGVAALTLAAEGARAIGEIRYSLGDWLPYVALGVVVIGAAIILWERFKQRREGWA